MNALEKAQRLLQLGICESYASVNEVQEGDLILCPQEQGILVLAPIAIHQITNEQGEVEIDFEDHDGLFLHFDYNTGKITMIESNDVQDYYMCEDCLKSELKLRRDIPLYDELKMRLQKIKV